MSTRSTITKICRVRSYLLRQDKSYRNKAKVLAVLDKVKTHLSFYPNANDRQLSRWAKKHYKELLFLIPDNKSGESLKQELQNIIS